MAPLSTAPPPRYPAINRRVRDDPSRDVRKGSTGMSHQVSPSQQVFGTTGWRRASLCGPNGGNCVEVNASLPGLVGVRDSKRLTGDVVLRFNSNSWSRFLQEARSGIFDRE
ncbi:DUF397 domain-containing protein [Saccharopolyspora griseoalba]|uniref:DUF397 domain-containing protein n=1 Tax=Saccharopolyspora griseoalba TaxID=1431848 RepID=A0ABW2LKL0_9PSEU